MRLSPVSFFYDNPEYKRHPNYTKTDQLPISEVITGLPRPYHHNRQMTRIPAFPSPNPIGRGLPLRPPLANQGARSALRKVAPRGNPTISPHTGKIGPHPRFRYPSIHLQLRQRGVENCDPPNRNRPARCGNPNPARQSLIGSGSKIKPATPGDDRVSSPDQKSLHTSTTPTTWGRKR